MRRLITCALLFLVLFLSCTPMIKVVHNNIVSYNGSMDDLLVDIETNIPCHVQAFLCLDDMCCWSDRLETITGECEGKTVYWNYFIFPDLPGGEYKLRVEATTEDNIEVRNYNIKVGD
jgi:hypothetical protein